MGEFSIGFSHKEPLMVDDEPDIIQDRVFLPYPLLLKAEKLLNSATIISR